MSRLMFAFACFLLPATASAGDCAQRSASASHTSTPAVLDLAAGDDRFDTLVTAVKAAGLEEALSGEGPFTLFAPTDEAFARIDPKVLQSLLRPENRHALQDVLTFHVVPAAVDSRAARRADEAPTLNGEHLDVRTAGSTLLIEDAIVTQTDLQGRNGIVHVIDTVMLPANLKI